VFKEEMDKEICKRGEEDYAGSMLVRKAGGYRPLRHRKKKMGWYELD
jgi:hypothetical protein